MACRFLQKEPPTAECLSHHDVRRDWSPRVPLVAADATAASAGGMRTSGLNHHEARGHFKSTNANPTLHRFTVFPQEHEGAGLINRRRPPGRRRREVGVRMGSRRGREKVSLDAQVVRWNHLATRRWQTRWKRVQQGIVVWGRRLTSTSRIDRGQGENGRPDRTPIALPKRCQTQIRLCLFLIAVA